MRPLLPAESADGKPFLELIIEDPSSELALETDRTNRICDALHKLEPGRGKRP